MVADGLDDGICESFPAEMFVGVGFALLDSEDGVEEEDALFGPGLEVTVVGALEAFDVGAELFVDVDEGGRGANARHD